ncbi:hypothetical protein CCR95_14930 [Thiocystis minor]|uniref:DUF6165 family protein n=1 Tax=Thiocystis minor TaxID=61597 RepID=UPI001912DC7A|nr:DUF6165 family protein [Thiocystis minor]MBK5965345.1 hypothetical protein [Thiocystis minor]
MSQGDDCPESFLLIPVSLGELLDRISILTLKQERLVDIERRRNVTLELGLLTQILEESGRSIRASSFEQLHTVNAHLWDLEDRIRQLDCNEIGDRKYARVARDIHRFNDVRHDIKRAISVADGSSILEEKEYAKASPSTPGRARINPQPNNTLAR